MRRAVLLCAALMTLLVLQAPAAQAWKPYTHFKSGEEAWSDVTNDGQVSVNGREYAVNPAIVTALQNQRSYYNAGVIGPDGFPDIVYGQAVIHPEQTGKWVRHVLTEAWGAQSSGAYTAAEKEQILAFAYGFATHAAGDMWAHTFVNDFALGVFPSLSGILNGIDDPMMAVRHLIVEGYVGDATPGYDGNDDRGPVPGEVNEDGDPEFSSDSTPGISFDAPKEFIYQTLVNPNKPLPVGVCGDGLDDDSDGVADDGCPGGPFTANGGPDDNGDGEPDGDGPEPSRGQLIDFFLDLQADIEVEQAEADFDVEHFDCVPGGPFCEFTPETITVNTVRGNKSTNVSWWHCTAAEIFCVFEPISEGADTAIQAIVSAYIDAWVDDIEDGLRDWGTLGLASTRALFDARTLRQAQDFECRNDVGSESDPTSQRSLCEDGVGVLDTLEYTLSEAPGQSDFINQRILSMVGLPDFAGDISSAFGILSNIIDDVVGPALNPLAAPVEAVEEEIKDLIEEEIEEALQVDLEQIGSFLKHPSHWINIQSASLTLPFVGTKTVDFFAANAHERLDALMGITGDHHAADTVVDLPGVGPVTSAQLADDAEFDPNVFAAYRNTVRQAKLLLLDGPGLNSMLKDELVSAGTIKSSASISTYDAGSPQTNIMFEQLSGQKPWLRSIDSDHAWRANGLPRFCDEGTAGCPDGQVGPPTARPEHLNGGEGTYPIWESCLLRPSFRTLYTDWENPGSNYPDLGDAPSSDPSDPNAPDANLALSGTQFQSPGGTLFVSANHTFTASGADDVFTDASIALQYRFFLADGPVPGADEGWIDVANGGTFKVTGPDGLYKVQIRSADPCHTFAGGDGLPAGAPEEREVFLDQTPPTISITSPPAGSTFDTDDFSSIEWTATDAGSGVKEDSGTFDGAAATNGQTLDMFFLYPGTHTIVVSATDNVLNTATSTRTFELHATSVSLLNNVKRACGESGPWPATPQLITKNGICTAMKQLLGQAVAKHASGDHPVEHTILEAWVEDLEGQRGKAVDAATADRFIAYAEDLVAIGG